MRDQQCPLTVSRRNRGVFHEFFTKATVCTRGVLLILFWSVVIHSTREFLLLKLVIVHTGFSNNEEFKEDISKAIGFLCAVQAISYLLYPLAGLLAEMGVSRYKLMLTGTVLAFVGKFLESCCETQIDIDCNSSNITSFPLDTVHCFNSKVSFVGICVGIVMIQIGLAMFEANVIQFGVNQLPDYAQTDKNRIFVNWYIWTTFVLNLVDFGIVYAVLLSFDSESRFRNIAIVSSMILSAWLVVLIPCMCMCRKHLNATNEMKYCPISHIWKVLDFARKHKQPLRRSALAHAGGESSSRIDYAKKKYGGPFTTDQVEDVKTFCRISLILLTLFGSMLQSDSSGTGFSFLCIQYCLLVVWIPLQHFVIEPCCFHRFRCRTFFKVTIIRKMGVGLLAALCYNITMLAHTFLSSTPRFGLGLEVLAFIFYGCSLILVFLSFFQFILAQAPLRMQGLLIGLWYAYQSFSVMYLYLALEMAGKWELHAASVGLSLVSFSLFVVTASKYKYRVREEYNDRNWQVIVEEHTERQILCDRSYGSTSSSCTVVTQLSN